MIATPGKKEIHHAVSTKFRPSETSDPQDGCRAANDTRADDEFEIPQPQNSHP